MLFLLKIALPPVLVAAMSVATRLWGPTIGGLLLGLPWMTGPVLFFLARDKGEAFGVGACVLASSSGVVCLCAYMLAYAADDGSSPRGRSAWARSRPRWLFLACAWALQDVAVSLCRPSQRPLAAAGLLADRAVLLPRSRTPPQLRAGPPWWDIPARVTVAFGLVAIIMLSADVGWAGAFRHRLRPIR